MHFERIVFAIESELIPEVDIRDEVFQAASFQLKNLDNAERRKVWTLLGKIVQLYGRETSESELWSLEGQVIGNKSPRYDLVNLQKTFKWGELQAKDQSQVLFLVDDLLDLLHPFLTIW